MKCTSPLITCLASTLILGSGCGSPSPTPKTPPVSFGVLKSGEAQYSLFADDGDKDNGGPKTESRRGFQGSATDAATKATADTNSIGDGFEVKTTSIPGTKAKNAADAQARMKEDRTVVNKATKNPKCTFEFTIDCPVNFSDPATGTVVFDACLLEYNSNNKLVSSYDLVKKTTWTFKGPDTKNEITVTESGGSSEIIKNGTKYSRKKNGQCTLNCLYDYKLVVDNTTNVIMDDGKKATLDTAVRYKVK